jgi:HTH-type transcriptional regulator / antitoxin HigA
MNSPKNILKLEQHWCNGMITLSKIISHPSVKAWSNLENNLFVPHNEIEYQKLVAILDELIDIVGEDESHPLASLMEVIGVLIENYEDQYVTELSL